MKSTPLHNAWQRLVNAARKSPAEEILHAPYGFSSRIVALSSLGSRGSSALLSQLTWKPLLITSTIMLAAISFNFSNTGNAADDLFLDDPVGEILDLG